jgi:hypothetical protein
MNRQEKGRVTVNRMREGRKERKIYEGFVKATSTIWHSGQELDLLPLIDDELTPWIELPPDRYYTKPAERESSPELIGLVRSSIHRSIRSATCIYQRPLSVATVAGSTPHMIK